MKRILVILCISMLTFFLVSCGESKYLGSWSLGPNAITKMIEDVIASGKFGDSVNKDPNEYRITKGRCEYELMGSNLVIELNKDNSAKIQSGATTVTGTYTVTKDGNITISSEGEQITGSFDKKYNFLFFGPDSTGEDFGMYLEKTKKDSKQLVYIWPEIEKGKDAIYENVKALIDQGADVNFGCDWYGAPAFFYAICNDCPTDVVLYLIDKTKNDLINVADTYGTYALTTELGKDEEASVAVVKKLLEKGADISLGKLYPDFRS